MNEHARASTWIGKRNVAALNWGSLLDAFLKKAAKTLAWGIELTVRRMDFKAFNVAP